MCSNFFFVETCEYRVFLTFLFPPVLCVIKAFGSNKSLSSAPLNRAPVSGCRHVSCVRITQVCLCVCASVCACENVWIK